MWLPPLRAVGPRALVQGLKVDELLVHRYSTVCQDGVELYGNAKCGFHYFRNLEFLPKKGNVSRRYISTLENYS